MLRLANKGWLADLWERSHAKTAIERLTPAQRSILDDFDVVIARLPRAGERLREHLHELATIARTQPAKRRARKKKER